MDSKDGKNGFEIAMFAIATGELTRIKEYVDRGRRFMNVCPEELRETYVRAYRSWSESPLDASARVAATDVDAEYELRKMEKPIELVMSHIEVIVTTIADSFDNLPDDRKEEINDDLLDQYDQAQQRKN